MMYHSSALITVMKVRRTFLFFSSIMSIVLFSFFADLFSKSTENQRKRKGQRPFKPSKRHKPDVTTDKRLAKDQVGTDSKKKRTRNETSEGSKDITSNRRSKKSKEAFSKGTLTHRKSTFSFKAKAKFPKTTKKMRGR